MLYIKLTLWKIIPNIAEVVGEDHWLIEEGGPNHYNELRERIKRNQYDHFLTSNPFQVIITEKVWEDIEKYAYKTDALIGVDGKEISGGYVWARSFQSRYVSTCSIKGANTPKVSCFWNLDDAVANLVRWGASRRIIDRITDHWGGNDMHLEIEFVNSDGAAELEEVRIEPVVFGA